MGEWLSMPDLEKQQLLHEKRIIRSLVRKLYINMLTYQHNNDKQTITMVTEIRDYYRELHDYVITMPELWESLDAEWFNDVYEDAKIFAAYNNGICKQLYPPIREYYLYKHCIHDSNHMENFLHVHANGRNVKKALYIKLEQ